MAEGAIYEVHKQIRTITPPVALVSVKVLDKFDCRKGMIIFNDAPCAAYITYGPVASITTPTKIIGAYAEWYMPGPAIWLGEVSAIREGDFGPLAITEMI